MLSLNKGKVIDAFTSFMEDELSWQEFEEFVSKEIDTIEELLKKGGNDNLYMLLMETRYSDIYSRTTLRGRMSDFLDTMGVVFQNKSNDGKYLDLIHSIPHKVYNLSSEAESYIAECILPNLPENFSQKEQKAWLFEQIKKDFPYVKPPKWIQDGGWPMGASNPMSFMGQINITDCGYYDDETSLYVFFDPNTGEYKVIKQSY